jgi:hypothetical protein
MVGAKPAYVWDVSQTSGGPVPERPRPMLLEGDAPARLWDGLAALVEAEGYAVLRVEHEGMIRGPRAGPSPPAAHSPFRPWPVRRCVSVTRLLLPVRVLSLHG